MSWWKWTRNERLSMAALGSRNPKNLAAESHDSDVRAILALLERFKSDNACVVLPASCQIEVIRGSDGGTFVPEYVQRNGLVALDADGKIKPFKRGDVPIGSVMSSAQPGELVDVCLPAQLTIGARRVPGVVETEMECRQSTKQ